MDLLAGIDIATADVRALAVDANGSRRAAASAPLSPPWSPRDGWSEQDATAWWPAAVDALRQLCDQLGAERDAIRALAVCATSGTVVAVDRELVPVGPALMHSDQRAVSQAQRAQQAAHQRWAALGLHVQPSFGLPKWAWLLDQPGIAAQVARLAHASDVVVGHLVGNLPATDWSHALKSGYDPRLREWAAEAMEALGIDPALLPEVRRPTEPAGTVSRETTRRTGLPPGCEVRLGMTDACAAQLAVGASEPGRFVSVLGSTLVLKGASCDLVADPAGSVYSHRHPDGWWLPGGASSTGAQALTVDFGDRDLAELDGRAARHGTAGAVRYPLAGRGERFPFAAPDAEGFTLGEPADEVDRYRATLEGVAFVERLAYERMAELGAPASSPVRATGGGSTSAVWNRIRATVLNLELLAVPEAGTSLGACMLAAAGGVHPDASAAMSAMAGHGTSVEPFGDEQDALERSYQRFVAEVSRRGWLPAR